MEATKFITCRLIRIIVELLSQLLKLLTVERTRIRFQRQIPASGVFGLGCSV